MSFPVIATHAALLATLVHPQFGVTAGPYKAAAVPGAVVAQQVSNHGTLPERITIGVDEIGRNATGACGFTHRAPLAVPSVSSVYLKPGESRNLTVKVAPTGPAGYHAVTVGYTVAGSGNVKIVEGVATVIGVTYPGSAPSSAPCVAVSATPASHSASPLPGLAVVGVFLAAVAFAVRRLRRRKRKAYQGAHAA